MGRKSSAAARIYTTTSSLWSKRPGYQADDERPDGIEETEHAGEGAVDHGGCSRADRCPTGGTAGSLRRARSG